MTGIVFFQTADQSAVVEFYVDRLGADQWLHQEAGCTILKLDTLLLGFCASDTPETKGIITIVLDDRAAVDQWYDRLTDIAEGPPTHNPDFEIYQFFARDPEGRTVEIQSFEHETPPVTSKN